MQTFDLANSRHLINLVCSNNYSVQICVKELCTREVSPDTNLTAVIATLNLFFGSVSSKISLRAHRYVKFDFAFYQNDV